MFCPILSSEEPITLVGGGEGSVQVLNKALQFAPLLVAADGGARLAFEAGHVPRAVVGDFDSLGDLELGETELIHTKDQNLTDFQKCLASLEAPLFVGVGFLGGRLDHQMASFTALLQDTRPIVLLSETEIALIAPRRIRLDLPLGMAFALYPLLETRLTSRGLVYPLEKAEVAPDGLISTSNEVAGPVEIETDRHGVLIIAPLAALEPVVRALRVPAR
ncbi:MAG: thiamine diphosphokinase [Pseudomonadota bacterium]